MNIAICAMPGIDVNTIAARLGEHVVVSNELAEQDKLDKKFFKSIQRTYKKLTEDSVRTSDFTYVGLYACATAVNATRVFLYREPNVSDKQHLQTALRVGTVLFQYNIFDMENYDIILDTTGMAELEVADKIRELVDNYSEQVILLKPRSLVPQIDTYRGNAHATQSGKVPVIFVGGTWFLTTTKPVRFREQLSQDLVSCKLTNIPMRVYTLDSEIYAQWNNIYGVVADADTTPFCAELSPEVEFRYRKASAFKRSETAARARNELEALCSPRQCKIIRDYIDKGAAFITAGSEYSPKHEFLLAIRRECKKGVGDGVNVYDANVLFHEPTERPIVLLCLNDNGNSILLESIRELRGHQFITKDTASLAKDKIL